MTKIDEKIKELKELLKPTAAPTMYKCFLKIHEILVLFNDANKDGR